jgi:hypothetical protein
MKRKTDVSIIPSEPPAIKAAKAAIVPAAVFIIVEIMLVAETISVILLTAMYRIASRNPEDCALRHAMTGALGFTHRDGSAAYGATFRWNDAQRDPDMIKRRIKEALR